MILFKDEVQKSDKLNERLEQLLNKKKPGLVRLYARLWKGQQNDITYQELREMILTGEVDSAVMERWYNDYSQFVTTHLMPVWKEMMETAGDPIHNRHPLFVFDPNTPEIAAYVADHAAELISTATAHQVQAIKALVNRATVLQDMTVDELAMAIRPTIGLYKDQAVANLSFFRNVKQTLLENNPHMRVSTAEKWAKNAAVKYAERQQRYRAQMIARSELSFAYNNGEYNAVRQAFSQGYIGRTRRRWVTADEDRACSRCRELDGVEVEMDEEFPNGGRVPPDHPHCRCVVNYVEVD